MKELTQEDLKHIAEELDTSMEVYVHTKTKEILSIPSDSDFHEDEHWADAVKLLDENPDDYVQIPGLFSREVYGIMEEFASTQVKDAKLQARLEKALANRKPFRNFKWEV